MHRRSENAETSDPAGIAVDGGGGASACKSDADRSICRMNIFIFDFISPRGILAICLISLA